MDKHSFIFLIFARIYVAWKLFLQVYANNVTEGIPKEEVTDVQEGDNIVFTLSDVIHIVVTAVLLIGCIITTAILIRTCKQRYCVKQMDEDLSSQAVFIGNTGIYSEKQASKKDKKSDSLK